MRPTASLATAPCRVVLFADLLDPTHIAFQKVYDGKYGYDVELADSEFKV